MSAHRRGGLGLALALRAVQDGVKVALADVVECLHAVAVEKLNVTGRQRGGIAESPCFKVRTLCASIRVSAAQCDKRCERAGRGCVGDAAGNISASLPVLRLQAAGLHVTAVQNPLTSIEDSVAETRRVLALQDGPTVLAAHSWSGTVISEIGTDPKVSALVYVAARAPDANEDFVALSGKFPTMPVRAGVQNHDGFTTISEEAFIKYFANGVQHEKAEVLYAVQQPTAALFGGHTTVAAWRTKPSWYAVSKLDETISPDLERFLAKRMKAHTIEVNAGHLSLVSHPREIADLILEAAGRGKQAR